MGRKENFVTRGIKLTIERLKPGKRVITPDWMERFPMPESLTDVSFHRWVDRLDRDSKRVLLDDIKAWELKRLDHPFAEEMFDVPDEEYFRIMRNNLGEEGFYSYFKRSLMGDKDRS